MLELSLTFRNLTTTRIELKRLERYRDPNATSDHVGRGSIISRTFNRLISNGSKPSKAKLAALSETFRKEDVSVSIYPFESKNTNIQRNSDEILRLTFEADGQQHQAIITSSRSPYSSTLTCLSPNTRLQFTAIHHPKFSHLSIFYTVNTVSWMSKFEDDIPLSALSIPGTHNSPTCYTALPSVRCQAVGVKEQLQNGVRFLDIRVQPENPEDPLNKDLILVHSVFPISLTGNKYFRGIINKVDAFLDANPSETVIISLKREGVGKSTDQQLSKILYDHYACDKSRWFTENRIPTLGEARGKIVLMRRFCLDDMLKKGNDGGGWAIDAENWPDNCSDGSCLGGNIRIQDFYEVSESASIQKKIDYSVEQLVRSAQSIIDLNSVVAEIPKQPFFLNFLSASSFWSAKCWPNRVAAQVNPHIVEHLCRKHNEQSSVYDGKYIGHGGTGIVVIDWAGKNGNWDLVKCIVGMNTRLEVL